MFVKNKNYDNAIQKVRIEVGTLVGLERDEEAFITLKELPTAEMLALKEASEEGETKVIEFFKTVIPRIIVDHNFYETEQKKMSAQDLTEFIFEKIDLSNKVISEYSNASFFTQQKHKEDK